MFPPTDFVGLEWQLAAKARVVPFPHQCCARPTFAQDIAGCSAIPFMSNQCITFQFISNLEDLKQGESSLYNSPKWKIGVHFDSFKKPLVLNQKVGSSQIWLLPQKAWWYHSVFHQKCMRLKTHGEVDLWVYRFYRIPIQHNSTRHPGKLLAKIESPLWHLSCMHDAAHRTLG